MFRKRMIEEFEWKLEQSKAEIREELEAKYAEKFKTEAATFKKASEIQQELYDKKVKAFNEALEMAYKKGREEVLTLVKQKIQSGEIVRGKVEQA